MFLDSTLRLRSACELARADAETLLRFRAPDGKERRVALDEAAGLTAQLRELIATCRSLFADPRVTELTWNPKAISGQMVIELPPDFPPPKPFKEPLKALIEFKK